MLKGHKGVNWAAALEPQVVSDQFNYGGAGRVRRVSRQAKIILEAVRLQLPGAIWPP